MEFNSLFQYKMYIDFTLFQVWDGGRERLVVWNDARGRANVAEITLFMATFAFFSMLKVSL